MATFLAAPPATAQAQTTSELDPASTALKDASRDCRVGEAKLAHEQKQLTAEATRWFRDLKQAEKRSRQKARKGQDPANLRLMALSVLAGLSDKGQELAKKIEARADKVDALNKKRATYRQKVWAFEHRVHTHLSTPVLTLGVAVATQLDAGKVPRSTLLTEFKARGLKLGKTLRVIEVKKTQAWIVKEVKGKRVFYLQLAKGGVAVFPNKAPKGKTKTPPTPADKERATEKKRWLKAIKKIKKRHTAALKKLANLQAHAKSLAKAVATAAGRHTWRPPGARR